MRVDGRRKWRGQKILCLDSIHIGRMRAGRPAVPSAAPFLGRRRCAIKHICNKGALLMQVRATTAIMEDPSTDQQRSQQGLEERIENATESAGSISNPATTQRM